MMYSMIFILIICTVFSLDYTISQNRAAYNGSQNIPPTVLFASDETRVLNISRPMFNNDTFLCGNISHNERNKKRRLNKKNSKSEQLISKQSALNCSTFSDIVSPHNNRPKMQKSNNVRNTSTGGTLKTHKKEKTKIYEKSKLRKQKVMIPFDKLNFVPRILYKDNRPYRYLVHRRRKEEKEYDFCKSEQAKNYKNFSTDIKGFSKKKSIQQYIFDAETDVYVLGSKLLAIDALGVVSVHFKNSNFRIIYQSIRAEIEVNCISELSRLHNLHVKCCRHLANFELIDLQFPGILTKEIIQNNFKQCIRIRKSMSAREMTDAVVKNDTICKI